MALRVLVSNSSRNETPSSTDAATRSLECKGALVPLRGTL